jgi:acetyl esterase/lipase
MHVDRSMIHPELRKTGALIRTFLPSFTERKFRLAKVMIKAVKGKCRSKLQYVQKYLPRADGSLLRICVYSPLSAKADVPGLLWLHGGGYALGTPEQDELFIRRFVEASGCVVVSPDYRLSVDAPYPAALEDCCSALLWLKEHGGEYGMRDDQIMIGGGSAGGGLTAAVSLHARDKKEVAIAFQMPLYPMLDDRMNTLSATNNDAPLWNSKSNFISWKLYLGDLFGKPDIPVYAAPARAENLRGLPPTCSFVGSIEPFRDETVTYVEHLRASGVPVHFRIFDGCFHGFDIVCAKSSVAHEAADFLMDSFRYATKNYFSEQPSGLGK